MTCQIKRGDVVSIDFEPVRGSEQGKVCPAVVIQNDIGNLHSPTLIVAPITSGKNSFFPVNVEVKAPEGGLANDSLILLNQIRTVDRARVSRFWGKLEPATMVKVDRAIKISLGLIAL